MKTLAPIILFTYNRPEHTRRTLESLTQNELADQSTLYIYADGPKKNPSPKQLKNIEEVRRVLEEKQWCKKVNIIKLSKNLGLADSIIQGVTEIVNKYGKIIVLEDDLVLSSYFLQYMNDALDLYENEERVMHISGYMFPLRHALPETFFLNIASCWGWATWLRAWKHFNPDAKDLLGKINRIGNVYEFNLRNTSSYLYQLEANANGNLKTWAIKWHASVYLLGGLCLHPRVSLVQNIGNDGSGTNCGVNNIYYIPKLADRIEVKPIELKELAGIKERVTEYYININKTTKLDRIKRGIKTILKGIRFIKGKIKSIYQK